MKKIFFLVVALSATLPFLSQATDYYWNGSTGNWNDSSKWRLTSYTGTVANVVPGSGNVAHIGNGTNTTITLNVNATITTLDLEGSGQIFINTSTSKTLNITGDINDSNTNGTGGGSATIIIGGTGTQNIYGTGTSDKGKLPNLTINKSGGTLYLHSNITMGGSTMLTYTTGTVDASSSDVIFYYNNTIAGKITLDSVEFQGNGNNHTINDSLTVTGPLVLSGGSRGYLNTGFIKAKGDITITSTFFFDNGTTGTATIVVCGTGNQTLTGSGTTGMGCLCDVNINKSDTLFLKSITTTGGNWTLSGGVVNATKYANTLAFYYTGKTLTGSMTFYNLEFYAKTGGTSYTIATGTTLTVKKDLKFGDTYYLRLVGGTINAKGDITITNTTTSIGTPSSTYVVINGDSVQTIYGNHVIDGGVLPNITIAKSDTLYLRDTISNAATWRYTSGVVNCTKYNNLVAFCYSDSIIGSHNLSNVQFHALNNNYTYTFGSSTALTVNNRITFGSTNGIILNGGTINAHGDIYIPNTKTGSTPGSTSLIINGSGNQLIAGNKTLDGCKLPNVTINKSADTLFLKDTISIGGSWTYTVGAINATKYGNLAVFCYNNSITGSHTLNRTMFYADMSNMSFNIASGTALTAGNLFIKNTSTNTNTITGSGSLVVTGDIANSSTLTISCNNLTLSGTANQNIPGTTAATISKLTINKASGTVKLNKSLTLTSNLTLTKGILIDTITNLLTLNNGTTANGASDSSYVSGPVKKIGSAAFKFPVGGNSHYRPLRISSQASSTEAFTVGYKHTAPASDSLGSGVTQLDSCESWYFDHTTGSNTVTIALHTTGSCFKFFSLSHSTVGYLNGGTWTSGGSVSTGSDSIITSSALSNWGDGKSITIAKTNPLVTANAGSNATICSGSSHSIGGSPSGGTSPFTCVWSPSTGLSSSTVQTPTASPTSTTTYTVTVTDAIGEFGTASVVVTVNPLPGNNAGSNVAICNGASTPIGGSSTTGHSYSWTPSTGLSSTTISNPTASPTISTTYTLTETITATGCSASNTMVVTVNPIPVNNAGSNRAICMELNTTLGANNTSGHTYSWSPSTNLSNSTLSNPIASPTITTTYTLTETITATGCSATNSVTVTVNSNPTAYAGSGTLICIGSSTTIGTNPAATGGSSPYTYAWSPSNGLSSSTIMEPTAYPIQTTTYLLTATDINGCSGTASMTLTVDNPVVNTVKDTEIYKGYSAVLGYDSVASGGTSTYSYNWTPSTALSSSTIANPTATPTGNISYTFTITDANSCTTIDTTVIKVMFLPTCLSSSNTTLRTLTDADPSDAWLYFDKDSIYIRPDSLFISYKAAFGLGTNDSMKHSITYADSAMNMTHERFLQYYKNIPVEGAEYTLHSQNGFLSIAHGRIIEGLDIDTSGLISDSIALLTALDSINAGAYYWQVDSLQDSLKTHLNDSTATYYPKSKLVITNVEADNDSSSNYKLAYFFQIYAVDSIGLYNVYIDATNGEMIKKYPAGSGGCAPGTVNTRYNGSQSFTSENIGGGLYVATDICSTPFIYALQAIAKHTINQNFSGGTVWLSNTWENQNIYGGQNPLLPGVFDGAADLWGCEISYLYFNGLDPSLNTLPSNVTIVLNWNYDFNFTYSTGTGLFTRLASRALTMWDSYSNNNVIAIPTDWESLDVIGHEYTHLLINQYAHLPSAPDVSEGAALNESLADIFGTLIERHGDPSGADWIVGSTTRRYIIPFPKRNLLNPAEYGQPSSRYGNNWDYSTFSNQTTAYTNDGVPNHFFYNLQAAIGIDNAAAILMRTLKVYLNSSSKFNDARNGSVQSAIDIFGPCSSEAYQTGLAWYSVGVGPKPAHCISVTGPDVICTNLGVTYPVNYVATTDASGTYTWSSVSGYTTSASGNVLHVTDISSGGWKSVQVSISSLSTPATKLTLVRNNCSEDVRCKGCGLRKESQSFDSSMNKILIYPNPVSDMINIKIPSGSSVIKIELFNLQGQMVQNSTGKFSDIISFPISTYLQEGCYILRVKEENLIENFPIVILK